MHSVSVPFLSCIKGTLPDTPPVWFMRQAGRHLPEYRELRRKAGSFMNLCLDSELAALATLQPVSRYDTDAAILFADILLIAHAMGVSLRFEEGKGPQLHPPAKPSDLPEYENTDISRSLEPVFNTVRLVKAGLAPGKALIGFAGAPWTVMTYMLAGGTQSDPAGSRREYYRNPSFIRDFLGIIADKTVDYLVGQIDAGADAVQLFESWATGLPWSVLEDVSVRPLDEITRRIKEKRPAIPVILFPKGAGEKMQAYARIACCDVLGIDYCVDPVWVRENIAPFKTIQGGPDPLLVLEGGKRMEAMARRYLEIFSGIPYVFNLGHGLHPQTPVENVYKLMEIVREG